MQIVLENIEKQICFIYICKCAWVTPYEENSLVGFLMYSHWIRREAESLHGSIFVGFVLDLLLDLSLSQFLTHTNTQTKVNKTYRNEFLFFFFANILQKFECHCAQWHAHLFKFTEMFESNKLIRLFIWFEL